MKTKLYDAIQYVSLTDVDSEHLDELCKHYKMNRPTLLRELLRQTYKNYCLKIKKK